MVFFLLILVAAYTNNMRNFAPRNHLNIVDMIKKIFTLVCLMLTMMSMDVTAKTLVVYYSYTNHCHEIVTSLTSQITADVVRVEPAEKDLKYEANNYAIGTQLLNAIKAAPESADSYPAIDPVNVNLSDYDNIIIVTPLWWSQMAAIMQTYLFNNGSQLAGKHVGLIVSSHSSGISQVVSDAQRLIPNAIWMGDALWINNSNHSNRDSLIENWLNTLNMASDQSGMTDKIYITIDGKTQSARLVGNSATQALVTELQKGPVSLTLMDNRFEIWGPLGFSLPTSNEQIDAQSGDIVLYNGSNICIFYGSNSYSYTRLGKIEGLSADDLKSFLKAGENNISVVLSASDPGEETVDEDAIKISDAGQTTWCSAYDLDFTGIEGIKAYTAGGYDRVSGTIWLMRVNQVPANEGILIIGTPGDYKVPHKTTGTYYANLMKGTLQPITIYETEGEYTNYYLSNGDSGVGFYKVNGSVALKANRAYLPLLKGTTRAGTRFIGIGFEDDGTTNLTPALSKGEGEGEWYTLQGQRVAKPGKGLYIRNGKMVIVR